MRLAKFLAHGGVASRRASEEIIREGRVTIGGEIVLDPARDVDGSSKVAVDGVTIAGEERRVVFAVNKPAGYVSTAKDTHERRKVVDLVPGKHGRLYPVGRLDADSTGLILLTNDGALAHKLTHPSFEVSKTYRVKVTDGPISQRAVERLRQGVKLDDGRTAPARVNRVSGTVLELTIHEGRKHQVRRMCEAVGHPVLSLQRVKFGPLQLNDLAPGKFRKLSVDEVELLRRAGV
ncbi:MAG: rRNA pseudouridine synthase [Solirubrobacteraceae bacterium]|nr:rRNA pseudouridine synthase [Solirubrobacteraceae bacterium]